MKPVRKRRAEIRIRRYDLKIEVWKNPVLKPQFEE